MGDTTVNRLRFSNAARVAVLSVAFVAAPLVGTSAGQSDAPSTGASGATGGGATGGGTSARADDHDHGMDWGWTGLLGLLGLAGLARRKDRDHVHVAPGTTRH